MMRTYGLPFIGRSYHCGWGCCFYSVRGVPLGKIIHGRKARTRNYLKRCIKKRERQRTKDFLRRQLEEYDESEDQPPA